MIRIESRGHLFFLTPHQIAPLPLGRLVRFVNKRIAGFEKAMSKKEGRKVTADAPIPKLAKANEKAIGFWLGCAVAFLTISVTGKLIAADSKVALAKEGEFTLEGAEINDAKYLRILRFISEAANKYPTLFVVCIILQALMILSWFVLVFITTDPGVVYADRNLTYSELLEEVTKTGQEPDTRKWCKTTLVKKPLRAKFDAPTGLLVARHDHYCVWLDTCVGFGNHRGFFVFLILQVAALLTFSWFGWSAMISYLRFAQLGDDACLVVKTLLGGKVFGLLALTACANVCSVGLGFLLMQQLGNVCSNITTNERMNWRRYPWLQNDSGKFFNRFDLGAASANVAEFLFKKKDYKATFDLPQVDSRGTSSTGKCCNEGCSRDTPMQPIFAAPRNNA